MSNLAALLKAPPFTPTKPGDPDQLLQDWLDYSRSFKQFLKATTEEGEHTENHVDCGACGKGQAMLRLIGGKEMETLLDYVGAVEEKDTLTRLYEKVEEE